MKVPQAMKAAQLICMDIKEKLAAESIDSLESVGVPASLLRIVRRNLLLSSTHARTQMKIGVELRRAGRL